jgi:hypothetical protein
MVPEESFETLATEIHRQFGRGEMVDEDDYL